jgi:hypothetical protein
MTLHKIKEFYTEWFSACLNKPSIFRTITTFKTIVKNNDQIKLVGVSHDFVL